MQTRTTPSRPRSGRLPVPIWALPITATLLLAGCSAGSSPKVAAVASIPTAAASGSASTAAAASASSAAAVNAQRPQLRVDTSDAEHARLQNIWANCLHQQGVPTYQKAGAKVTWVFPNGGADKYPKAWATCQSKQPLGPASEDPDRNPHYSDNFRDWVKCINQDSAVMKVIQTKDGWTFAKSYPANDAVQNAFDKVVRNCEFEAFGRG